MRLLLQELPLPGYLQLPILQTPAHLYLQSRIFSKFFTATIAPLRGQLLHETPPSPNITVLNMFAPFFCTI
jgi:hypothetical protein